MIRIFSNQYIFSSQKAKFLVYIFLFFFCTQNFAQNKEDKFTIVLDAGHGGKDPGNRGNNYYEKKVALSIVLKVGRQLEKDNNLKVIYTRKKDVFVDLIERANIANESNADLFISVHCDYNPNAKAFGAGTFVLGLHANERNFEVAQKENSVIFYEENYQDTYDGFDPNNPESVIGLILMQETYLEQSIKAANAIQKSFTINLRRKDRKVKQAGFIVLKYTYMPSVLIEVGFLSNKKEGAYLNTEKGQNQIANAIVKAILNYKKEIQTNTLDAIQENSFGEKTDVYSFKVQILAGKNKLGLNSKNFKGLSEISREKHNSIYRYYYGKTFSFEKAKDLRKIAIEKGYKSAFIVAFDTNNKRVSVKKALEN